VGVGRRGGAAGARAPPPPPHPPTPQPPIPNPQSPIKLFSSIKIKLKNIYHKLLFICNI